MKTVKFKQWNCKPVKAFYGNGRIAIQLIDAEDGEPIATATINIPDEDIKDDEVIIKDYSENEGMLNALLEADIIEPAHRVTSSGYVFNIPICKFKGI